MFLLTDKSRDIMLLTIAKTTLVFLSQSVYTLVSSSRPFAFPLA